MTFDSLRAVVVGRLDEADRGDRGWFLTTRVHLMPGRLSKTAEYLYDIGAKQSVSISARDYAVLAQINGVGGSNPGITLRRHQLLAMERPLRLLERADGDSWERISLTRSGVELATSPDVPRVLEQSLADIVFCAEPWYTPTRVAEYSEFNVRPYPVALALLAGCDGWIDRDEFDLFVSRIRADNELSWALDNIAEFRLLQSEDRRRLLSEVRARIPGSKPYQNWRDMGLHTFSLLSLGLGAVRETTRLASTDLLIGATAPTARGRTRQRTAPATSEAGAPQATRVGLRVPQPPGTAELATPPNAPSVNSGTEGEIFVGKLLEAGGWTVVYYGNRRGFGFDIWARLEGSVILVEVKSSVGALGAIALTDLEYQAANQHRINYVIATVENVGADLPDVSFIQDPVGTLPIVTRSTNEYHIARREWMRVAGRSAL